MPSPKHRYRRWLAARPLVGCWLEREITNCTWVAPVGEENSVNSMGEPLAMLLEVAESAGR